MTTPTCREALQQIVTIVDKDGDVDAVWDDTAIAAARAALAAPDRVAALPPDVREALRCAADYANDDVPYATWSSRWGFDHTSTAHFLGAKCAAVLAKYPESATVHGQFDMLPKEHVADSLLSISVQHEAERAAWIRERDELIAERDKFEAQAKQHSDERRKAQDEMVRHINDAAKLRSDNGHLRFLAEWLLSELRKEES